MTLKKLYIHNYKSFYDTTVELDKFNIVIGENNSGKSNLVDVLEFINIAMTQDIEKAISNKGGFDKIKNYKLDDKKIIIRATFLNTKKRHYLSLGKIPYQGVIQGEGEYVFSFSFLKESNFLSVCIDMDFVATSDKEYLKNYLDKDKETTLLTRKKVKFIISNYGNRKKLVIKNQLNDTFIKEHLHGILAYIDVVSTNELDIKMLEQLGKHNEITTYYFDTQAIRDKSHLDDIVTLKKDGSNLGINLFNMLKRTPEFESISNSLIGTVNEIDSIDVYEVAGNYIIAFKEKGREININQVSDGTINLISTMTALYQPMDHSFMLVFEEPERHLHLKAINYMIEIFRDQNKQILITTHSTEILKHANLEEVVFIYRDDEGDTQSIRADAIPHIEEKMKQLSYERDLTLDELIADGIVGNFS